MRKFALSSGLVLLFVASMFPVVFASSTISGTATGCTSLAICDYTISNNVGNGVASTNADIGGYVGQNFTFSGGSLSFQLPGETQISNDAGVYNGVAINTKVFTTAAGLIYKINGNFTALDYNTGTLAKGNTIGFVGIKGHSGIGGGIYFILVNGSISFKLTSDRGSVTTLACNPSDMIAGSSTTCTVTVADPASVGASTPTGKVVFASAAAGKFMPSSCTLVSGSCQVTLKTSCLVSGYS